MHSDTNTLVNEILINEQPVVLDAPALLTDILQRQGQTQGRFVVVVNDSIVPRSAHASAWIHPGDRLEIIAPISGG